MNQTYRRTAQRIASAGLAGILFVSALFGCGKREKEQVGETVPKTEILTGVYRGTVYPLPEGYSVSSMVRADYDPDTDTVTCYASGYFEENDSYEMKNGLFRIGQDGVAESDSLDFGPNVYVENGFDAGDGFYFLASSWDEETGKSAYSLIRRTEDGVDKVDNLAQFFPSAVGSDWFHVGYAAADGEGRIYLSSEQEIAVLNPDMTLFANITVPTWIDHMAAGADGIVYISGWFENGEGIAPLDPVSRNAGKPMLLPDTSEFAFGPGFDVYLKTNAAILGVNFTEDGKYESEVVMDFVNSNISPDETELMRVIDRDTFLMSERTDEEDWNTSPVVYRHAEDIDLSTVTVIELAYGSQNTGYSLPAKVVAFNKKHPEMRIVVKDYSQYAANDDWEGGINRLASDMVTGVYRPDVVVGYPEGADLAALLQRKLYLDLMPYAEKDDTVNPDNLFGCVKSAFSDGDALWGLAGTVSLQTLLSTKEILGKYAAQDGWTIGDFLDFAASLPADVELGEGLCQDSAAMYLGGSYAAFVDEEAGTCSFDGEDFVRWLEFLVSLPKSYEELRKTSTLAQTDWEEQYGLYHQGKVALKETGIHDIGDFIRLETDFGTKDYKMIGFPAKEGSSGTWLRAQDAYAVTTWCENPDAAWEVVKAFCDGSLDQWLNGIPSLKSRFEEQVEEYYTYEFEFYFDGSASWGTMDPNHPRTEDDLEQPGVLTHFTKDDADRLRAFLDKPAVLPGDSLDEELTAIVNEELSALSAGVSSPADCAKKIQSRASIWLAENK